MNKKMMRLFSWAIALMMVLGLFTTMNVKAAGTHNVTIENSTKDMAYKGYKIFDVEVVSGSIAYKINTSNPLYSAVQSATNTSGKKIFKLVDTSDPTIKKVLINNPDANNADVLDWVRGLNVSTLTPAFTGTGNGDKLVIASVPEGYFYISSALNTVITISTVDGDVTVFDKNQAPGFEEDPNDDPGENSTGTGKTVKEGTNWVKTNEAHTSEVLNFKINANVPKYHGENLVKQYVFTDTFPAGLTYDDATLVVKLNETALTRGTDYTAVLAGNVLTITLPVNASYKADSHVEITYQAKLNEDAVKSNVNTVAMDWTEDVDGVDTPGSDTPSTTTTNTYGFSFTKVDAGNNPLTANFKLYDAITGGTAIKLKLKSAGVYVVDAGGSVTEFAAGTVSIFGLEEGTYYLEETEAPVGFNKLDARQAVTITASATDDDGYSTATNKVVNVAGTQLPSTGGIGTTVFYIIGGILMLGAVVFLVTNKRMKNK